ncbi:acyl-CoA dehydrogenase family protein [Streptomyces rapamycinicus]|uniref:Acyl-CoA dehydrogenase n=2 Tax=Streptomyces rapamycinicus TaxID=1226757 RepID=A0A0A0NFD9_STRRN|nr:acyl-CoA dehydrogenase family protein [Streptomyces rapamycinicus]AGP55719.1 acyl-CoA dehydrogenase [Streptomyces rapamycinicus NRRL 5491]MBB4783284.1 alkylation response protein AidB-like acyl-CoA dehydrogenase [Streptomyces rapamycinicus]RLV81241.1 acyl-CoA dehydrogenase [Streptomyces rapamycinicus NRRL 5491]UTO63695.1 acyl-CoA/acyl-ACP dehydrogenase [Streptomyces rapamycinicus]UTP31649.1 acyl-CoA/acyl-ACP dehydrogenase [Streptomyces rapamycinicus NRRL 5491]
MDAAFTEEQDEIRRTLRTLLRERCGPDEVKAAVQTAPGYDEALWRRLAGTLGLPGLALSAAYGGVGCGVTELALACEETGRVLLPSPLLATAVFAAPLVAALGTEAQRAELLPRIADGALTAALAVPGRALAEALGLVGAREGAWAGGGRAGGVQARPDRDGGAGWRLYGQVEQVPGGHSAELLLVAARAGGYTRGRTLLFLVRAGADGLARTRLTALDATRPQARIELRNVSAELLGVDDGGSGSGEAVAEALAAVGTAAAAVLAAEAVGAADAALTRTVEYVRAREQFGRPIGSFQAVKHRLADVYVAVQAARSAAYYAAWAAAEGGASGTGGTGGTGGMEAAVAGGLALAQALEAQRTAAAEAVQLHGGIGFTWEHDAHLYFKRAASDELLFGPVHRLRARAAEREGLFGAAGRAPYGDHEGRAGRGGSGDPNGDGTHDGPDGRDGRHGRHGPDGGDGLRKAVTV